jgi:ABC-type phosphate/phosphonate transport system substrate-binding protein
MWRKPQKGKMIMQKNVSKLAILAGLLAAASLTGCNQGKEDIHLQLVPSNDPTTLLGLAKRLSPILEKYVPEYSWSIDVGDTYAATTSALVSGQIDGGFLTASGYAQETIENPGKVEVLLSASRAGYKVQADDFPGFDSAAKEKQRAAMNGLITTTGEAVTSANKAQAYVYRGDQSATQVSYYSGIIITLNDTARKAKGLAPLDANGDGNVTLQEFHDANAELGHMGATSGSGWVYPSKFVYDQGFTGGIIDKAAYDKLSAADQAKAIIGVAEKSYPASVDDVMQGKVDGACGFMDIRYGSAYVQASTASSTNTYYHNDSLFINTYTLAITDPIMNDTISVYSGLADAKKEAIKKAFKAAVADGDKNTDGTGAYLLYQIYSHTGYVDAKDSDYDAAREMYNWTLSHK